MEPKIKDYSPYPGDIRKFPRATTVVFDKAWPISIESKTAVNMDLVTEDATFAGLANTKHESGDLQPVVGVLKCVAEFDLASAAAPTFGAGHKYNAGSASATYKLEDDGGANTICNAAKVYSSNASRIEVMFDVTALGKLIENNA